MGKQTSRMYGIKVKEKINYYDFGDICISYENNVWTVKAGFHDSKTTTYHDVSWWLNGVEYNQGDTIVTFNEGDDVVYKIMEQHTDTVPYVNYFYDIYGNASENVEYGNKDISYRITGNNGDTYSFKIYTLENGIIKSTKVINYKDIQKNKELFDKDYLSVYNMLVKWHGMDPESGYLQMSFELISNSNYIFDLVGNAYPKNTRIANFQANTFLGLALKDDTNKHEAKRVDKDVLPAVKLIKRLGGSTICEATKDKKTIHSEKFYDHMDVYYNGKWHDAMYLVYDSPQEEGCWVGKGEKLIGTTDLALTYADPYWFLMTLKSGIEYGGRTYESKKLVRVWKPDTVVNMTLKKVTSRNKYKITKDDYETIIYGIQTVVGEGSLILTKKETSNDDSETIYPSSCPMDFYGLTINIDGDDWVIISKDGHIKYNKKTYGKNAQIVSFNRNDDVNITMDDDGNRYQTQKEIKANYETILYYIQMSSANPNITVTKQIMTENTNTESGKTEKVYTDIDTKTITPSDSPFTFYNIQFKINNAQTVWTIYSKCRYITYGGRNYPINRSIIDLPTNEDITIEIKDESNKYEVQETCTYYIKTPDADTTVDYEIHTAENTLDMKIVKTDGDTEEPWVTVRFYEAMYAPFEFGDVSLKFYNNTMEWELFSNSDKLYYLGNNKKKGETLGTWRYTDVVKFDSIVVTHANTEALEISTKFTSTSGFVKNDEVDASIDWSGFDEDEDFHLSYNPGTGMWTIKNGNKIAYHSGLQYMSRQVILQFKTKTIVDNFDIAYRQPDEHGVYTYKIYHINSDIDVKGITSVNVSLEGHNSETFFDKNLSGEYDSTRLLTKDAAKSLYGYIWKRDRGPGPTPPSKDYVWDVIPVDIRNDGNGYRYICMVNTTFGSRVVKRVDDTLNSQYNRIRVDDKFYFEKLGLVSLTYQESSSSGVYTYSATISNSKMRWTYRSSDLMRDFVQANLPFVKARSTEYVQFQIAYAYTDPGVHTFTKVLWNEYMSIRKSTISESVTLDSGNHYYGVKYYEIEDPIIFVYRPNSPDWHIIQYTSTEQSLPVAEWINIDDLSVTKYVYSRWRDKDSIVQLIYDRAVQYFRTLRIYEVSNEFSTASYTIGNFIFYISGWGRYEYAGEFIFYSYSVIEVYNYKTDAMVESPVVIEATDLANSSIFEFYNYTVFEGKYIYAYKPKYLENTYDYEEIEIYQADITNVESILTPTLVNTISKTQQINCFLLESGTYETLTSYDILFEKHSYTWEGDVFCETILYDDRIDKFGKNKTGFFRPLLREYLGNGIYNDKLMVYIPDPSFQSLNNVFGFMASTLRYSSQINEPQPSPEPHN